MDFVRTLSKLAAVFRDTGLKAGLGLGCFQYSFGEEEWVSSGDMCLPFQPVSSSVLELESRCSRQLIDPGRHQRWNVTGSAVEMRLFEVIWRVVLRMCFPLSKWCLLWSGQGIPCGFLVQWGEQIIAEEHGYRNDSLSSCKCALGLSVGWQVAMGYAVQLFWRQVQRASQWGRKCCVETVSLGHVSVRSSQSCILLWLDHIVHLFGVKRDLFKVTWML